MRIARAVDSLHHLRPTTPHTQPLPGITRTRFSLIRYRSPLHTESQLFSSPTGTEMFHFPASTPTQTMYSPAGNTTQLVLGFPIRTSSDQRLIDNSPRLNAAFHVLHRLSMPRHPPCALNNEHTNHPHNKNAGGHTSELDKKLIKEKRNHTNTHKQTTKAAYLVCLMLASTIQFSHNTPTTPCQHKKCQQATWSGTKKGG